ncbi:aspartate/glutamate racemase family protein [Pleionea sp. CnH1-48]|uniref:aspartate/glutamate racemase family protein n=1 Tax=Pleionea sp. CnH1-48 TaxID=2954494 RepID=UPI002097BBEE|nr:amino acid racemase [Pleionea sp. CnH1-48]MCO7223635.1 amino acid racemase [Pleionea sp. CnH1-48]
MNKNNVDIDSSLSIGIVGCSSEGAALCYQTLCQEAQNQLGNYQHPQIAMHTHSLSHYVDCLKKGNLQGVADLMLSSANHLKNAGAQLLICPDNTIHQAFEWVEQASPLPWLHIARVVAAEAKRSGYQRLGLTGTHWLVNSSVYPGILEKESLACVKPNAEQVDEVGRIIMEELVHGVFKEDSIRYFQTVINNLKQQGCDAVILGCTEIPLIINDGNSALPTLDSTRLLAKAALKKSLEGVK